MKRAPAKGLAHSIQARLKAKAEREGRPFAELLDLYGIERLVHRIARSKHGDRFILKGALLIRHWLGAETRPTRDIDLMGPDTLDAQGLKEILADILRADVEEDGLDLDLTRLRIEPIRKVSAEPGYRATFEGHLGQMAIHYQVDIVPAAPFYPADERLRLSGLLGMPLAEIRAYTPSSVVAEKLEAMVALGDLNSRMKDYHDVACLAMRMAFEGQRLTESIRVCFRERGTALPEGEPIGLSHAFAGEEAAERLWAAFARKVRLPASFPPFASLLALIREFTLPPLHAVRTGVEFPMDWPPGGPWQDRGRA